MANPAVERDGQTAALFGSLRASRSGRPSLLRWAGKLGGSEAVLHVVVGYLYGNSWRAWVANERGET